MNKGKFQKGNSLIMVLGVLAVIAVVFVGDDVLKSLSNSFAKSELGQTIARGGKGGGSGSGGNPKGTPGATSDPGNPPPPGGNPPPPPGGGNPTPTPVGTPNGDSPYPGAPLCPDSGVNHDNSKFHTLWDSVRHCHYDHEHGTNPFTTAVANVFPSSLGLDLKALIGNVEVGHTNLSSPLENTLKHGGFKWNVQLSTPENCTGFEGATNGSNASVVQYHAFGDEAIELEARVHTALILARQCNAANPTDYGYFFTIQFQDYGQRVVPYQGTVMPYPNQPVPAYDSRRGPYLTFDCVGPTIQCRRDLTQVLNRHLNNNSNWTSGPERTGGHFGSELFSLLFRLRDGYRLLDWNDQTYPFTFLWLCSSDEGRTYNPTGCRYNNSTTQVHEISGKIPAEWDNKPGFDSDSRVGRVTAQGFVTRFGGLNTTCRVASSDADCFPVKMVNAFVGTWGSVLVFTENKGTNIVTMDPKRDIYFCNGRVCNENDPGSTASGWIGASN